MITCNLFNAKRDLLITNVHINVKKAIEHIVFDISHAI